MDDQTFLNTELQQAVKSGDEVVEKLVYLHYQQAMLEALKDFQPCEQCVKYDLTLLKRRVARLLTTNQRYLKTVAVLPMENVKRSFAETQTLLGDVGQLCKDCQQSIRQSILTAFRHIRTTS